MDFSVKASGFSGQTKLNSCDKNIACQPIKEEFGNYNVNFGNSPAQFVNSHGDSVFISSKGAKPDQEMPISFGQKFVQAAALVSEKLKGKNNDANTIGKELGKELYGIEIS